MSLISNPNTPNNQAEAVAAQIRNTINPQFRNIFTVWDRNVRALWSNKKNTQKVFDELGTDAREVIEISVATVTFLETLSPGCTAETLKLVGKHTINDDGTVTVD